MRCREFWIGPLNFAEIAVSCSARESRAHGSAEKMFLPRIPSDSQLRSHFRGCLLGGAVGDALGGPVEFLDLEEIVKVYGEQVIPDKPPAHGKLRADTDDPQITPLHPPT